MYLSDKIHESIQHLVLHSSVLHEHPAEAGSRHQRIFLPRHPVRNTTDYRTVQRAAHLGRSIPAYKTTADIHARLPRQRETKPLRRRPVAPKTIRVKENHKDILGTLLALLAVHLPELRGRKRKKAETEQIPRPQELGRGLPPPEAVKPGKRPLRVESRIILRQGLEVLRDADVTLQEAIRNLDDTKTF